MFGTWQPDVAREVAHAPLAIGQLLEHAQALRVRQRARDARGVCRVAIGVVVTIASIDAQ